MSAAPLSAPDTKRRRTRLGGLARFWAMFVKEFLQLRRDRVTFATMIFIPLMQLLLFGFAINTQPKDLPTAVLVQENTDVFARHHRRPEEHLVFPADAELPKPRRRSITGCAPAPCNSRWRSRRASSGRCAVARRRRC